VPLTIGKKTLVRKGKSAAIRKAKAMSEKIRKDFVVVKAEVLIDYK
jgi:hypothetical protein